MKTLGPRPKIMIAAVVALVMSASCIVGITREYKNTDHHTPARISDGELCEIEEADGTIIYGDHDDFVVHAGELLNRLLDDDAMPTAESQGIIDYIKDCLREEGES